MSKRRPVRSLLLCSLLLAATAHAASVVKIAGLGEEAPGGGVYAGSGFTGNPAAAGNGWVAFRSLIAGGSTSERIILANMAPGGQRKVVAALGAGAGTGLGTFGSFVGSPAINASGDVAFVATLNGASSLPPNAKLPAAAALFVYENAGGTLAARLLARADTAAGLLAFVESFDGEDDVDLDGRGPAMNDAGDIAFTAATRDADGKNPAGAVFLLPAGGSVQVLASTADASGPGGGHFTGFGAPALNGTGGVAFHGRLAGGTIANGIFRWKSDVLAAVATDGDTVTTTDPRTVDQTLTTFGDAVAIRDDDAVAFTGEPMFDYTFVDKDADPDPGDAATGLLFSTGSGIQPLLYPGQNLGPRGRVSDARLESEFASAAPAASFAANGDVVAYAILNGGSSEILARIAGPGSTPDAILAFSGTNPDPSPAGGTYLTATATPTADDAGGVVVIARLSGGPVSDALVYEPASDPATYIAAGSASPSAGGNDTPGILAGPPFTNPAVNDSGDIVFRAFVANGPAGVGLYRSRNGTVEPLVRVGDAAPLPGNPPFTNIVGEHDMNDSGTVAFAAVVPGKGRGVYVTGASGTNRIAAVDDPGPAGLGTNVKFVTILGNPSMSADGAVAFRGRVQFTDPQGATRRRDGIFVRSGTQVRALALAGDASPATLTFFRFRDIALRQGARVAFTAALGEATEEKEGLFVGDLTSLATIAIAGESLDGKLTSFASRPLIDDQGVVALLARVDEGDGTGERAAIVRGDNTFFERVVEVGDGGPAGGVFRSIGRPTLSPDGDIAFRATFEPNLGGVGGFYLQQGDTLAPFVSAGDAAPTVIGGRFSSFNQRAALSNSQALAFISSLTDSSIDNGLFVGSQSSFRVNKARIKLGTSTKADTMTLAAEMNPGSLAKNLDPGNARLTLSVRDAGSAVWDQNVTPGDLVGKKSKYVFRAPPDVGMISIKVNRKTQVIKLKVKAQPDFSGGGIFPFEPPATVRLELGDVSGQATVACATKKGALVCK